MIVKMSKVFVVSRGADRDRLLAALGELGVVHLKPVDPDQAVAAEQTVAAMDRVGRAVQILAAVQPAGESPQITADEAAAGTLKIQRESAEQKSRLAALHRQLEQLALWGDVRLEQFARLRQAGVEPMFFSVPKEYVDEIRAELVHTIGPLPGKRLLVAVIDRGGPSELPEQARPLELPPRDRPSIRAEAADIDSRLKQHAARLAALARLIPAMQARRAELQQQADFTIATRGGLAAERLFAIQGWLPADAVGSLSDGLAAAGMGAAVRAAPPAPDEAPPTLIRYPRWARPIKGLFDILGTLPGYDEIDVSGFFMLALPLFAAMIIGDAGYGLIFLLAPLLFYRRAVKAAGHAKIHLVMVLGAATIVWGLLSGNVFGLSPQNLIGAGGVWAAAGRTLSRVQLIHGDVTEQTQTIMKLSFIFGAIHLSVAQLRQAMALAPGIRALSRIGWALFLWGIFGIIWYLFFGSQASPPRPLHWTAPWLLSIGAALAVLFERPGRNPFKAVGIGLASFPLTALGTFSDSISYIRLMGVGLASTIIGQTFNELGALVAGAATWFAAAPVLLFGHGLNIAMCMIAILAHGVRLNMLEFSNNAGVQWAGYPYRPFAGQQDKEQ